MLYFMLTAAFDLKMMSHWVLWSAHYGVIDGCQSGGRWQLAMGGGEQMPADFRGLAEPGTEAHAGKQKQMGGLCTGWAASSPLLRLRGGEEGSRRSRTRQTAGEPSAELVSIPYFHRLLLQRAWRALVLPFSSLPLSLLPASPQVQPKARQAAAGLRRSPWQGLAGLTGKLNFTAVLKLIESSAWVTGSGGISVYLIWVFKSALAAPARALDRGVRDP